MTRLALTIFAREDILAFLLGADDPRCDPHHSKLNISALMYRRVVYGAGDTMARGVSGNIQLSRTRRDLDEIGGILRRGRKILNHVRHKAVAFLLPLGNL